MRALARGSVGLQAGHVGLAFPPDVHGDDPGADDQIARGGVRAHLLVEVRVDGLEDAIKAGAEQEARQDIHLVSDCLDVAGQSGRIRIANGPVDEVADKAKADDRTGDEPEGRTEEAFKVQHGLISPLSQFRTYIYNTPFSSKSQVAPRKSLLYTVDNRRGWCRAESGRLFTTCSINNR